jgi:hypothetical protein
MDSGARAKANVPRPTRKQDMSALDSYHRFVKQASKSTDRIERPYTGHTRSFSMPRRSPLGSTDSSDSSNANSPAISNSQSPAFNLPGLSPSPMNEWPSFQYSRTINNERRSPQTAATTPSIGPPATPEKKEKLIDVPLPWRPFYLQRRILSLFAVLFAGLLVALEAVLAYSRQNMGVGSPERGHRYIWQFAPTAIVTLVTAMWARAEYQSKAAAPWLRMAKGPADVDKTLLLDYLSMINPTSIIRSLKNRDFLVTSTSSVTFILRVLVVLAAALITPTLISVGDAPTSMTVQGAFANDLNGLNSKASLAFFAMLGLQTENLTLANGLDRRLAYQPFTSSLPATAQLRATVDGFSGGLDCDAAQAVLQGAQFLQAGSSVLNVTVSTANCVARQRIFSTTLLSPQNSNAAKTILSFQPGSCDNSTALNDGRVVVVVASVNIEAASVPRNSTATNVAVTGSITQSTALICRPRYTINSVLVTRNANQLLDVSMQAGAAPRTLSNVHPFDIVRAHFESFDNDLDSGDGSFPPAARYFGAPGSLFDADDAMRALLAMQFRESGALPQINALRTVNGLSTMVQSYFQQYSALLARHSLLNGASTIITGRASIRGERIIVRDIPTHIMAALLGICLVLTLVAIAVAPTKGFLPRGPNTVMDMATLLAHSRQLLQCLRGTGAADIQTIREKLKDSNFYIGVESYEKASNGGLGYFKVFGGNPSPQDTPPEFVESANWGYPLPLKPWVRIVSITAAVLMIVLLEVLLRVSDRNNGLANIRNENVLHILWTAGPALIVSLLALYVCTVDCATRCLAPYMSLRQGASFETSVGLDMLDKSKIGVLYWAIKTRNPAVVATTITAFLSCLLAIFAGALYTVTPTPSDLDIDLRSVDFFANSSISSVSDPICITCHNETVAASLILNGNSTYPDFTFEDLSFPTLAIRTIAGNMTSDLSDLTIDVTLPAVRPRMTCRRYSQSEITTNLTLNGYRVAEFVHPLRIDIAGEPCRGTSERFASNAIIGTATGGFFRQARSVIATNAFFGRATARDDNPSQCSQWLYVWGQLARANSNQTAVMQISALACNETMETVDTAVTLRGPELRVDTEGESAPRPDDSTARANSVALPALQYGFMANLTTPNLFDPFFTSIVASRFAIPESLLGDGSSGVSQQVGDAILKQHRIIRTQSINVFARRRLTPAGTFPVDTSRNAIISGIDPNGSPATVLPAFSVSARTPYLLSTPLRLVQDLISTRILQSVISAVLALTFLTWVLTPGTPAILPRNPCSIASIAALLADGNVFGFLGRGAEWMDREELGKCFMDGSMRMGFKMGWERVRRRRREEDRGLWGVGAGRNEEKAFSISVARAGGWGGGEDVGLGIMARVGMGQRGFVRGWGRESLS